MGADQNSESIRQIVREVKEKKKVFRSYLADRNVFDYSFFTPENEKELQDTLKSYFLLDQQEVTRAMELYQSIRQSEHELVELLRKS